MLDSKLYQTADVVPLIEPIEPSLDFPKHAIMCKVWKQVGNILQYSWLIEKYLKLWAILTPMKCNTISFKVNLWDFGWRYHFIRSENGVNHAELFNDAEYYLALDYDGITIAFAWFCIREAWVIEVVQLQWAKLFWGNYDTKLKHNWFLKDFNWREYLIEELLAYIRYYEIWNKLKIQSAKNNPWLEISSYVNCQPGSRWYEAYDRVALDLGFSWTPEKWYEREIL